MLRGCSGFARFARNSRLKTKDAIMCAALNVRRNSAFSALRRDIRFSDMGITIIEKDAQILRNSSIRNLRNQLIWNSMLRSVRSARRLGSRVRDLSNGMISIRRLSIELESMSLTISLIILFFDQFIPERTKERMNES